MVLHFANAHSEARVEIIVPIRVGADGRIARTGRIGWNLQARSSGASGACELPLGVTSSVFPDREELSMFRHSPVRVGPLETKIGGTLTSVEVVGKVAPRSQI